MLRNPDGRGDQLSAGNSLAGQMRALQESGTVDFGYFDDDFRQDRPPLGKIAPAMSLRVYPVQTGK